MRSLERTLTKNPKAHLNSKLDIITSHAQTQTPAIKWGTYIHVLYKEGIDTHMIIYMHTTTLYLIPCNICVVLNGG